MRWSGLRPDVGDGSCEEIDDSERRGTALQIASVECVALHQQDADDVPPLAVRDFISKAEPSELLKEDVLWRLDVEVLHW